MHTTHGLLAVVAALFTGCASAAPEAETEAKARVERRTLLAAARTDDGVYHLQVSGRLGAAHLPVDPTATAPVGSLTVGGLPAGAAPVPVEHVQRGGEPLLPVEGPPRLVAGADGEVFLVAEGHLTRLLTLPLDAPGAPTRRAPRRGGHADGETHHLAGGVFEALSALSIVAEGVGLLISFPFMALALCLI